MARIKAFTLVEFLTTLAVFAVFAAILTPITVRAKQAAGGATTVSNLRVVGMAAITYAVDNNDRVVPTQQGTLDRTRYWQVVLLPYVFSRSTFFDPTRPVPTGTTVSLAGATVPWFYATTLGINEGGYSNRWITLGNTCAGRRISYQYGARSLSAMSEPSKRVAFAPVAYGATSLGWSAFSGYQSNWINPVTPLATFSYNNMVWNTNTLFVGNKIPVARADGSAGTVSRSDFKSVADAPTLASYCAWMSTEGQRTWGPYWNQS